MVKHKYYHNRVLETFKFIVPENKSILFIDSLDGYILANLKPSKGLGIETNESLFKAAKVKYKKLNFKKINFDKFKSKQKFDYIILDGSLGKSSDISGLLNNLRASCNPSTRILIYQHNHLWQWILALAEKLNFKRKEGTQNWLSIADTSVYLKGAGFEATRVFKRTLSPISASGLGNLINWLGVFLPFFDFLKLDQYILARPCLEIFDNKLHPKSLTICITVRNEKENIEKIVKNLPVITNIQEILFVEGHSTDGTREEIERVSKKYPRKNVRVIGQPGKGQGDAIRVGFKDAKGDIIILYEGDGTSDIRDLKYFYEAMSKGRFEFIEGSRFVYPLEKEAMPFLNKIGNIFFAKWFSFFLGQRITDVLSGIKAILKRDYELIYNRWGFLGLQDPFGDFELLYGAARMGLRIGEMPMRYYPRVYGTSKTNVLTHGTYLLRMAMKGYWIFRSN